MSRFYHVAIAVDQLVNALLSGSSDETLSARAYRCSALRARPKRRWVLARWLIDCLFFFQSNHCRLAYESELNRKHLPSHYQFDSQRLDG